VRADGVITKDVADRALHLFEVDELGMDAMDRRLLLTIIDKFNGGPVGIETLSSAISEERGTIEDIYEPFLMQRGFLDRTPRGRVVTIRAYQHLERVPKIPTHDAAQGQLWEHEEQP
jgi:holliday junction DNA helicase RuvB